MNVPTEYIFTLKTNHGETGPQYRCSGPLATYWRPLRSTYDTQALRVRCYRSLRIPTRLGWLFYLLCRVNLPHLAVKLPGYWSDPLFWTEYKA